MIEKLTFQESKPKTDINPETRTIYFCVGQDWPCLKTEKSLNLPDGEESTTTALSLTRFLVCA